MSPGDRAAEIAANVAEVRERIARACENTGREPGGVRLLAVTKTFPATDVAELLDLGCTDLGEAREQEATAKVAEVAALRPALDPTWTVLGRLQRNKTRAVARWAHEVQSVDSARLVAALDTAAGAARTAGERTQPLRVLVQVSLDGDPERGGVAVDGLPELLDAAAAAENLALGGLMAVVPLGAEPARELARLAGLAERTRRDHPGAGALSAGMSGDLEAALAHGSTCLRVGTALLGPRPIPSP